MAGSKYNVIKLLREKFVGLVSTSISMVSMCDVTEFQSITTQLKKCVCVCVWGGGGGGGGGGGVRTP